MTDRLYEDDVDERWAKRCLKLERQHDKWRRRYEHLKALLDGEKEARERAEQRLLDRARGQRGSHV